MEDVFNALLFLFQCRMADPEGIREAGREQMRADLAAAGFGQHPIRRAFEWLDTLDARRLDLDELPCRVDALRLFTDDECRRLDTEARGFLMQLTAQGILGHAQRELVLDRIAALGLDRIDADALRWIVLMVLHGQPGQDEACAWIENLMFTTGDGHRPH